MVKHDNCRAARSTAGDFVLNTKLLGSMILSLLAHQHKRIVFPSQASVLLEVEKVAFGLSFSHCNLIRMKKNAVIFAGINPDNLGVL